MSKISIRIDSSLEGGDSNSWDALDHKDTPFMKSGFLLALERSKSVGPNSGWLPCYLFAEREGSLMGACAAYLKTDSYGEYIFDWSWANASERAGLPYYPKLVVAAPFTPATGPRFLVAPGEDPEEVRAALVAGLMSVVQRHGLSSVHILFCTDKEAAQVSELGLGRRASMQFHWKNRGYKCFDDFLGVLKSRKRKQIRKERARALEGIDAVEFVKARDMSEADFCALDRFYRSTVRAHGGCDYMRPGFFEHAAALLPDTMLFAKAKVGESIVAGAVFFETDTALYGRYWGADSHHDLLHFEIAYYAAIERCIERGLSLFEAGAQGGHKLVRGFEPCLTHSCHVMAHGEFDNAIQGFLRMEKHEVEARVAELAARGPYRLPEQLSDKS